MTGVQTCALPIYCAILATSDCSYGKQHLLEEYPIVLAGSCNGALQTGVHHRASFDNPSKVALSLARAMGLTLDGFGHDKYRVTDGLKTIEV